MEMFTDAFRICLSIKRTQINDAHFDWSKHGIGASGEGQFVYPQTEFVACQSMAGMGI
jgi:hypothetical protein